ncbi:MAG: ABC transporter ATP-binding protein [Egibacteraceae bacterium]
MTARVLLPTATAAQTRQAVAGLVRAHRGLAVRTVVVLVAATAVGLAVPPLLGHIVDIVVASQPPGAQGVGGSPLNAQGAGGNSPNAITAVVAALLAATGAQGVLSGWGRLLVARLGELMLAGLREQVVERALGVPLGDMERAGTGDLVARVGGDVSAVSEAVREALPGLVVSVLTVGLTVVGLAALDWRLALAGLAAAPAQITATRWYLRRSAPIYAVERIAEGARAQQLHESIAGAATVRAYRLGRRHVRLVTDRSREAITVSLRATAVRAWFSSRLNAAELVGLGAILVVGFVTVRAGVVSVGKATAAALYFHRLFDPVGTLLFLIDIAQAAAAALARLVGVATLDPPAQPASTSPPADASVTFRGVRFAYEDGHEVLHGVDVRIAPGERVALVGPSGAGKSTVAKLIAGVHRADVGEVRLGNVEIDDLGPTQTRRTVTLVTQEVHVFAGTLADDLRLAQPDAADEQLSAALARVGALDWVETLPAGLDTIVGDGGHRLSATQAQQLALARLVLANAPIAILDEATAEAGSAGARTLEAAADAALDGRTALVIAHRLTQAAAADRIVVIDAGTVIEIGTHDQLVAAGGHYAKLWAAWSASRRA